MNSVSFYAFDTYNTIQADCAENVLCEAAERSNEYHRMLSRFEPCSDIWRLNHEKNTPVRVSADTVKILETARIVEESSGGAFSIRMGNLLDRWDIKHSPPMIPRQEVIDAELSAIRETDWSVQDKTVVLIGGAKLDIGGIAKGYIADRIADLLRERDVRHALINFGGNIVTIGVRPDGKPWRIGLQTPGREWGRSYWASIESADNTVVTSGIYERAFELNGKKYHHILDPSNGYPAQTTIVSVTVQAEDSMVADAVATAALILGPEKGLDLIHRFGAKGIILEKDGTITRSKDAVIFTEA